MKDVICMFCGHREIFDQYNVRECVMNIIIDLIENKGVNVFYTGGMGNFDNICSSCVREVKRKYKGIRLCLIIPYLTKAITNNKRYYEKEYDEIIEPDMGQVFYKGAILKRNRWMAGRSDYMIAYIMYDWGGAYSTFSYGKRKGKIKIIECGDLK